MEEVRELQSYLDIVNLIYKFLGDLNLPEYSKGYKDQQRLVKEQQELIEYNNRVLTQVSKDTEGVAIEDKDV